MQTPKLIIWQKHSVYLGTYFIPLKKYTVTADQLVVCLEGSIHLTISDDETLPFKTILIRAGTQVPMEIADTSNAIIAIAYLHPTSQDFCSIQQGMTLEMEGTYFNHRNEQEFINELKNIRDNNLSVENSYPLFKNLLKPFNAETFVPPEFDSRVITIINRIKETISENISIQELAEEVKLSESRLVKIFKKEIGLPITRYRLRYRIFIGVLYLAIGKSVTEAALSSGFSSTAHFSKCFVATMGIHPSFSFFKPPFMDIQIEKSILNKLL